MSIRVRLATQGDLTEVERLSDDVQALHAAWKPDIFRASADVPGRRAFFENARCDANWRVWVCGEQNTLCAYALTELFAKGGPIRKTYTEGHLHQICVQSEHRRNGIGRWLVLHVLSDLRASGADRITVTRWTANDASALFFRSMGFVDETVTAVHRPARGPRD